MSWEWEALGAVVRILFLLAPFVDVDKHFALAGDYIKEAREFALVGSCRAMLVSFPAQLLLAILAGAGSQQCKGVSVLSIAIYFLAALIVGFALIKIPTHWLRGSVVPFIWLVTFELFSVLAHVFGLAPALRSICQ